MSDTAERRCPFPRDRRLAGRSAAGPARPWHQHFAAQKVDPLLLLHALIGTALVAADTNALISTSSAHAHPSAARGTHHAARSAGLLLRHWRHRHALPRARRQLAHRLLGAFT